MGNIRQGYMFYDDDDLSEMIGSHLNVEGVRETYLEKRDRSWIRTIDDIYIRMGLLRLNDRELKIIEALVFERRNIIDIRTQLCVSTTEFHRIIKGMRHKLVRYIRGESAGWKLNPEN